VYFCYSFIILSILVIPFLILGEIYQKKFKKTSTNIFFQVIIDYVYAIPLLVIWSFLWIIFMLTTRKNKNQINTIKSFSILAIISTFSFWSYYSLAMIAFDDVRKIFPEKNPIKFFRNKGKKFLAIWVHSGFYFAIPFGIYILLFFINIILASFSLIPQETIKFLFEYTTLYFGIPSIIFCIFGNIISSQLNLLNYYIKESENIAENFVLNLKNSTDKF